MTKEVMYNIAKKMDELRQEGLEPKKIVANEETLKALAEEFFIAKRGKNKMDWKELTKSRLFGLPIEHNDFCNGLEVTVKELTPFENGQLFRGLDDE